jgi:ABC-type multidrug transport system ATPase subunit
MNNGHAVEAQDLRKSFGDFKAVQGVSFAVDTSEVLSLLGPNGAGKSTIISMLSGLLPPTGGDARIMGHSIRRDPEAAKTSLGVVPRISHCIRIYRRARTWISGARCMACAARPCAGAWTRCWRSLA